MDFDKSNDTGAKILSLISHKLRTPLSIITGYSDAIMTQVTKEKLSPFTEKAFEEINKQGNKMALLVDKLLRFTKVQDMAPRHVKKTTFNLKELLAEVSKDTLSAQEESGGVLVKDSRVSKGALSVEITCQDNLEVTANRDLLKAALEELIDNSLKFNNRIEKVIKLYAYKHSTHTSISIKDTGVGIRPQDVNNIFERFYQVDDFFTGQIEGWGLGLPLVKKIMDLHEGSVSVVSDKGLGSIFTINLPD